MASWSLEMGRAEKERRRDGSEAPEQSQEEEEEEEGFNGNKQYHEDRKG